MLGHAGGRIPVVYSILRRREAITELLNPSDHSASSPSSSTHHDTSPNPACWQEAVIAYGGLLCKLYSSPFKCGGTGN